LHKAKAGRSRESLHTWYTDMELARIQ